MDPKKEEEGEKKTKKKKGLVNHECETHRVKEGTENVNLGKVNRVSWKDMMMGVVKE